MATLEQMLVRLPRKTPDADFVDRLFRRIECEEIVTRVTVSRPPFERWQMEAYPPFAQEEGTFALTEDRPVEVDFYFYPPQFMRQRRSLSKIPTARQSFLWATGGHY